MSMNRAQRRKQEKLNRSKKIPAYKKMTKEQRIAELVKNGITADDLDREWEAGYKEGFNQASPSIVKTIYAAIALAANNVYGFGRKRTKRLLKAVDDLVVDSLTSAEIVEEVWNKIGLKLDFDDPMELIKEV